MDNDWGRKTEPALSRSFLGVMQIPVVHVHEAGCHGLRISKRVGSRRRGLTGGTAASPGMASIGSSRPAWTRRDEMQIREA